VHSPQRLRIAPLSKKRSSFHTQNGAAGKWLLEWPGRHFLEPHIGAKDRIAHRNGGCDKTGAVHVIAGNARGDRHDDTHHPAGSGNGPAARRSQATFEG